MCDLDYSFATTSRLRMGVKDFEKLFSPAGRDQGLQFPLMATSATEDVTSIFKCHIALFEGGERNSLSQQELVKILEFDADFRSGNTRAESGQKDTGWLESGRELASDSKAHGSCRTNAGKGRTRSAPDFFLAGLDHEVAHERFGNTEPLLIERSNLVSKLGR